MTWNCCNAFPTAPACCASCRLRSTYGKRKTIITSCSLPFCLKCRSAPMKKPRRGLKNSARSATNSVFTSTEIPAESFMSADVKIPRATYRLQFNEHFRLPDALALVPYFHELGISHIYASPLFKAVPHSVHGYDVCDFSQLNPELGTEADLKNLADALHDREMGLVLD